MAIAIMAALVATPLRAAAIAALGLILLANALYDARTQKLLDAWTLLIALLAGLLAVTHSPSSLYQGLASSGLSLIVLLALRWGHSRLKGVAGFGLGDVKLIAALALWLGVETPLAIGVASVVGLVAVLTLRPRDGRIAFGPAIAFASLVIGLLKEAAAWPTSPL